MKANELRIGNYFYGDMIGGRYIKATPEDILCLHEDPLDDYYQPIPLNPEILEKCGFVKVVFGENHWCVPSNDPSKSFEILVWSDHISYTLTNSFHLKIIHLHQLQNLYFALTGEELEVKL